MAVIIALSIVLQLAAAVMALRLIPLTRRSVSWILIAVGLVGMVHRRFHALWLELHGVGHSDLTFELVGLGVSIVLFVGVIMIPPVFRRLKDANDRLAESEERFRTIADFTYDLEYWRGPDGRFRYISPSCLRVTGYPRDAFYADPGLLERIVHPDDAEAVSAHISRESLQEEMPDLDFRIIAADGSEHWLSHRCVPVVDGAGNYLGTRASNRIIDKRKHAETELRVSRMRYRNLVEQAHAIVLELSLDGEIRFMNRYGQDFFGYAEQELIGRKAAGFLLPEKDGEFPAGSVAGGSRPKRSLEEVEVRRKNGNRAWLSLASALSMDDEGRAVGILVIGIDITALKAADKLKEDVERIVRHDLKSPLMGIVGLPQLLLEADNLTPKQREILRVLEGAGLQMLDLINQSLTLYKLESGTYDHRPAPTDWLGIVRQAARGLVSNRKFSQPVEISVDGVPAVESDQIVIPGDSTLLYCMAANLLKNALEAAGDRPVTVGFTSDSGSVVMEIGNSQSVPESVRDSFFTKYSTGGKLHGTGLGTYSARLAVEAHKGAISMETSEDGGTVVRVELPRETRKK